MKNILRLSLIPLLLAVVGTTAIIVWTRAGHGGHGLQVAPGVPLVVKRAVDGDTIEFENGERLRYIGIDTPEEVDPRKSVQCWAVEAAEANRRLVEGKTIVFTQDVSKRDKYGRWLGFVRLWENGATGLDVNAAQVKSGNAFSYAYKPDTSRKTEFDAAEAAAKTSKLGLWGHCRVTRKGSRKQTNDVK